jgi:hypothetical protein
MHSPGNSPGRRRSLPICIFSGSPIRRRKPYTFSAPRSSLITVGSTHRKCPVSNGKGVSQMTAKLNTRFNIKPWIIGILLSLPAMLLGWTFGSDIAGLLGGEPGIWARMGKGFIWGGVIAGLQWPVVRAVGVRPVLFIVASAVCFAVGYPFGQTIQAIFIHHWSMHWTGYWSCAATFGLFLGIPQWWIFRRHMHRASLWILLSVTGWILTGLAWIISRPGDGVDSIVYGIVTGFGLVWLVHSQPSERE